MNKDKDCDICGGELEIEHHYNRIELVCEDCGRIIDSEEVAEAQEKDDLDEELDVME